LSNTKQFSRFGKCNLVLLYSTYTIPVILFNFSLLPATAEMFHADKKYIMVMDIQRWFGGSALPHYFPKLLANAKRNTKNRVTAYVLHI